MKNYMKVDVVKGVLIMDKTFAERAAIVGSNEYNQLQMARRDYPTFAVCRREIKKNPNKECYKGLTYKWMEEYIKREKKDEDAETRKAIFEEFEEMKKISECHSRAFRYPTIKKWFLDKYPEIAEFGEKKEKSAEESEDKLTDGTENKQIDSTGDIENVVPIPNKDQEPAA